MQEKHDSETHIVKLTLEYTFLTVNNQTIMRLIVVLTVTLELPLTCVRDFIGLQTTLTV